MQQLPGPLGWLWHPDLILAIQRVFGPGWRLIFETLSLLGGAQITIVAVAWARWFRERELAARLLVALFLGIAVDLLIWNLYPTPRPDDPRIRIASDIPIASFPSGHLVTVLTLWGTLAAVRLISPWLVVAIAALVALARLGLGEHYPGDVLSGMLVGLVLLGVAAWLWLRLTATARRLAWPTPLAAGGVVAIVALLGAFLAPPGRWMLLGLLVGIMVGLPLEARFVGYDPPHAGWRAALRNLIVGLIGFLPLALIARLTHDLPLISQLLIPSLAALWIMLGAPLAFLKLDRQAAG